MAKKSLADIIKKSVLKNIDKDTYLDLKNPQEIECIPTGSVIVNKVIGLDGIPRGASLKFSGRTHRVKQHSLPPLQEKIKKWVGTRPSWTLNKHST